MRCLHKVLASAELIQEQINEDQTTDGSWNKLRDKNKKWTGKTRERRTEQMNEPTSTHDNKEKKNERNEKTKILTD